MKFKNFRNSNWCSDLELSWSSHASNHTQPIVLLLLMQCELPQNNKHYYNCLIWVILQNILSFDTEENLEYLQDRYYSMKNVKKFKLTELNYPRLQSE